MTAPPDATNLEWVVRMYNADDWTQVEELYKKYQERMKQNGCPLEDLTEKDISAVIPLLLVSTLPNSGVDGFLFYVRQPNRVLYITDFYCQVKGKGKLLLERLKSDAERMRTSIIFLLAPEGSVKLHKYYRDQGFEDGTTIPPEMQQIILASEKALLKSNRGTRKTWDSLLSEWKNSKIMVYSVTRTQNRNSGSTKRRDRSSTPSSSAVDPEGPQRHSTTKRKTKQSDRSATPSGSAADTESLKPCRACGDHGRGGRRRGGRGRGGRGRGACGGVSSICDPVDDLLLTIGEE